MKKTVLRLVLIVVVLCTCNVSYSQDEILTGISYREKLDDKYVEEQCVVDIYIPQGVDNFATVIWYHGGGLSSGKKFIPNELKNKGFAVVAVGYRLTPQVKTVDCIDDAAASTAWVINNIEDYGGCRDKIYLSGHSAGGYLVSMIGLDKSLLAKYGVDANSIAGIIPYSGQCITHFRNREERGIGATKPIIDEFAPLYHVRADASPILIISGDREFELFGRYEECAYFWRMLKLVGHKDCTLYELDGFNHGTMAEPAHKLLVSYINEREKIEK